MRCRLAGFPAVAVVRYKCWLPIQLFASLFCYLPYCCCRVVLCKCWLPIQLIAFLCCYLLYCCCRPLKMLASHAFLCCYLLYCCCRPLQMLASHTVVSIPLLLPSLLLLSSSTNAGFPYSCLLPYYCCRPLQLLASHTGTVCVPLLPSLLLLSSSANAGFPYSSLRPLLLLAKVSPNLFQGYYVNVSFYLSFLQYCGSVSLLCGSGSCSSSK